MNTAKYEMSKTYQYRKVMKPILERKRRARINKCLDELKDLIAECMQQSGDPNIKLEKADILELTVQHLRKIKNVKSTSPAFDLKQSFRTGYIQAANEVSRCLASLPNVDIGLGTTLMTHLGVRLNQLVSESSTPSPKMNTPLNVYCGTEMTTHQQQSSMILSPVSSGYGSDSDQSVSSSYSSSSTGMLLQVAAVTPANQIKSEVWRPW